LRQRVSAKNVGTAASPQYRALAAPNCAHQNAAKSFHAPLLRPLAPRSKYRASNAAARRRGIAQRRRGNAARKRKRRRAARGIAPPAARRGNGAVIWPVAYRQPLAYGGCVSRNCGINMACYVGNAMAYLLVGSAFTSVCPRQ